MIEDSIVTILKNASTNAGARISWDRAQDLTAQPYVVLIGLGGEVYLTHDAASALQEQPFQVGCYGPDGLSVRTLVAQCRAALHMFTGTVSGHNIQRIVATAEDSVTYQIDGQLYAATQDFNASYT